MLDRNRMHDVVNAAGRVSCLFFRPCDAGACARCVRPLRAPRAFSLTSFDAPFYSWFRRSFLLFGRSLSTLGSLFFEIFACPNVRDLQGRRVNALSECVFVFVFHRSR